MSFLTTLSLHKTDVARALLGVIVAGVIMVPHIVQHPNEIAGAESHASSASVAGSGAQFQQLTAYQAVARQHTNREAAHTLAQANTVLEQDKAKTDVTALENSIAYLNNYKVLSTRLVSSMTDKTQTAIDTTTAAAAEADRVAAQKAAAAAAAAAQVAAQAAAAQAAANTPDGARGIARGLAASTYGWGDDQFQCLDSLWSKESGWRVDASNGGSGATGIPQALPGSKMASAGADWATNAATQIKWGLGYIAGSYGTPCSAWSHSQSMNWY